MKCPRCNAMMKVDRKDSLTRVLVCRACGATTTQHYSNATSSKPKPQQPKPRSNCCD